MKRRRAGAPVCASVAPRDACLLLGAEGREGDALDNGEPPIATPLGEQHPPLGPPADLLAESLRGEERA